MTHTEVIPTLYDYLLWNVKRYFFEDGCFGDNRLPLYGPKALRHFTKM